MYLSITLTGTCSTADLYIIYIYLSSSFTEPVLWLICTESINLSITFTGSCSSADLCRIYLSIYLSSNFTETILHNRNLFYSWSVQNLSIYLYWNLFFGWSVQNLFICLHINLFYGWFVLPGVWILFSISELNF